MSSTLVVDQGTETLKVGLAAEDSPTHLIPTIAGYPRESYDVEKPDDCWIFGEDVFNNRNNVRAKYPIERKVVVNWDLMEKLWNYTFYDRIKLTPEEHSVLLTEPALNTKTNRERTTYFMLEKFNFPAFYLGAQPVLSLYATGKVTGIVVDSGQDNTHFVPIYEGYTIPQAVQTFRIAGRDLTEFMLKLLQEQLPFSSAPYSIQTQISKEIKETHCYAVADNYEGIKTIEKDSDSVISYPLPDGKEITLSDEVFRCPEAFFSPWLLGVDCIRPVETLWNSIMGCNLDIRHHLYSNILLSGGNTLFPGMVTRVQKELTELVPENTNIHIDKRPVDEHKFSAWIGGSILASLSTFQEMCISKSEYDEHGPTIVHRKCFT